MQKKPLLRNAEFWLALVLIAVSTLIVVVIYNRWISVHIPLGPFFLHHWMSWTGALFIAIFNPLYVLWKRRNSRRYQTFIRIHMFGNLLAFALISVHFGHHMGRPEAAAPEAQTGLVMYIAVATMVLTGVVLRFQMLRKQMRFVRYFHASIITTFYIILLVHLFRGLGFI